MGKAGQSEKRTCGAVVFPGFELLDIFGPLEMFGVLPDHFDIVMLGEGEELVPSAQGPRTALDRSFEAPGRIDILLLPGGIGTRKEVTNPAMLRFLSQIYPDVEYLASICTGSGILAASGLLNGRRATSNKRAFEWARGNSAAVTWVPEARWVEDGNVFTAAGVAAGIDMSLALIARLLGDDIATEAARRTEYEWHREAAWDPFARLAGLV